MKPIQVALVEDDSRTRDGWAFILNQTEGFVCNQLYSSGEAFLDATEQKPVDVVLIDIGLPQLDGVQTLRIAKSRTYPADFMMLTVVEDLDRIFEALRAGALGYMLKSCAPAELTAAIRDLVQGGAPMTGSIARRVLEHLGSQSLPTESSSYSHELLSQREMEVVRGLADGLLYKEIGSQLHISLNTVRSHIRKIYGKLQVGTSGEAVKTIFPSNRR